MLECMGMAGSDVRVHGDDGSDIHDESVVKRVHAMGMASNALKLATGGAPAGWLTYVDIVHMWHNNRFWESTFL